MSIAKKKSSTTTYLTYTIIAVVALVLLTVIFSGKKDYDAFAKCLAKEGYVMAGTESCSYCEAQKQLFKGSFEDVLIPAGAYKDCDREKQWCEEEDIQGYPTWMTPQGTRLMGMQSISTLAKISGCTI